MNNRLLAAILTTAIIGLSGCAGSNFVRPNEGELIVGQSTSVDVVKRMGEPVQSGELLKNDQQLKVSRYAYASAGGESAYPGVVPARSLVFTFFKDKLTSQEFVSSFKIDSTDFDGAKVTSITKGKTTKQEVISMFGKPSGEAVYPVIKNANDRAYVYSYTQAKGTVFNMKFYTKTLMVSFNESGVVTDVDYSTSGEQ